MTELRSLGRSDVLGSTDWPAPEAVAERSETVSRGGAPVRIDTFVGVMHDFMDGQPDRIPASADVVLAPLVHESLRLTRQEAGDKGTWAWLAGCLLPEYVQRRWGGRTGQAAPNRYIGQMNKHALARLWWGMELFRDGPDYPRWLFSLQDVPNSILHRPFVRNRPLSVSMEPTLRRSTHWEALTGDATRPWFSGINLYGGARDLAALGLLHRDDPQVAWRWVQEHPRGDGAGGPPQAKVSLEARRRAEAFLQHVWDATSPSKE
jgi:hypothetical protein